MKSILVLVPHCDDEILGCGGAIQYHIARGDAVSVCFVKDVYDKRSKQQYRDSLKVKTFLNYNDTHYLKIKPENFTATNINTLSRIEAFVLKHKPDILFTTHPGDTHQDHKSLYEIVKIVTRTYSNYFIKQVLCCETISSTNLSVNIQNYFTPNFYIKLSKSQVDKKILGLKLYKNELRLPPHPRSEHGVLTTAKFRGSQIGCDYAEAFYNLRTILD